MHTTTWNRVAALWSFLLAWLYAAFALSAVDIVWPVVLLAALASTAGGALIWAASCVGVCLASRLVRRVRRSRARAHARAVGAAGGVALAAGALLLFAVQGTSLAVDPWVIAALALVAYLAAFTWFSGCPDQATGRGDVVAGARDGKGCESSPGEGRRTRLSA
ncbi:hypothetical protein [Oerskovia sp. KBS0722]|uniref:hypothetical protein n=1 Tax=Oerskovia sp. KBS0722 TaxID=1179673 RepID=UPI00110D3BCC|nr:hypothetical protein [Oerskovia sp. KBS0722]QDW62857.1 hypothetical protein FFI11_010180 [Oerskovia sp. KBS0722]